MSSDPFPSISDNERLLYFAWRRRTHFMRVLGSEGRGFLCVAKCRDRRRRPMKPSLVCKPDNLLRSLEVSTGPAEDAWTSTSTRSPRDTVTHLRYFVEIGRIGNTHCFFLSRKFMISTQTGSHGCPPMEQLELFVDCAVLDITVWRFAAGTFVGRSNSHRAVERVHQTKSFTRRTMKNRITTSATTRSFCSPLSPSPSLRCC